MLHLTTLRKAGLLADPPVGQTELSLPLTASQDDIVDLLKPILPLPFKHLEDSSSWCLLANAGKRLADFGCANPSGAAFGTVVGSQKGSAIIEKTIYLGELGI